MANSNKQVVGYDVVYHIWDLSHSFDAGWLVAVDPEVQLKKWDGCTVGVLGLYNRGKSFLLSQLAKVPFEEGEKQTERTVGLSIKFMESKTTKGMRRHVIIDSAGIYRPLELNQVVQERKKSAIQGEENHYKLEIEAFSNQEMTERFLTAAIVNLSDYLIIVVNSITTHDQKLIFQICQDRQESERPYKEVWVVHNLRTTTVQQDKERIWNEICSYYPGGKVLDQQNNTEFFMSDKQKTRHVCIVDNDTTWGKQENEKVFNMMRTWIDSIVVRSEEQTNPIEPVVRICDSLLPKFVDGVSGMEYDEHNTILKAKVCGTPKVKPDPSSKPLELQNTYNPKYSIYSSPNQYAIVLEVPGATAKDIKANFIKTQTPNYIGVRITGTKKKILFDSDFNTITDKLQEGSFTVNIDIPNTYYSSPVVTSSEGQIILKFRKMEMDDEK